MDKNFLQFELIVEFFFFFYSVSKSFMYLLACKNYNFFNSINIKEKNVTFTWSKIHNIFKKLG
jgi:hypothetical protein